MLTKILKLIFGSKSKRDLRKMLPLVRRINELEESYQSLSDEELKANTELFKKRLADGETQRLQSLANALHAQGKTDSAITVARCMQARAATQHDTTALVGAGSALGVYLRSQGKLEEALKSYDEALRLVVTPAFVRTTDAQACEAVATLYMNLATLHVDMQNKAQATNCARKSEAWAARCPDARMWS